MGAGESLPQHQLEELMNSTNFNKRELKKWYRKFMKDYPHGELDSEQFMEVFNKIYKSDDAVHLAVHIFRSFDTNKDKRISFQELMCTFSVTSRGTLEERLQWVFNIYDIDGNGFITLEEIKSIVKCIKNLATIPEESQNVDLVQLFKSLDVNLDGGLSLDEFMAGIRQNPDFVTLLNGNGL